MRFVLSALISVLVATVLPAIAQVNDDNATLYMDAVALPKKARVCASQQADFMGKFEPAFAKWRSANKGKLAAGENQLRAEAKANHLPFPGNIESETDSAAQLLQTLPDAPRKERCAAILTQVAAK